MLWGVHCMNNLATAFPLIFNCIYLDDIIWYLHTPPWNSLHPLHRAMHHHFCLEGSSIFLKKATTLCIALLAGKGHQLIYNSILFSYQSASVKISLVLLQLWLQESHSKLQTRSWSTVKVTKAGLLSSPQLGCRQQAYKCVQFDLTLLACLSNLHVYQIAHRACCQWQAKCN